MVSKSPNKGQVDEHAMPEFVREAQESVRYYY